MKCDSEKESSHAPKHTQPCPVMIPDAQADGWPKPLVHLESTYPLLLDHDISFSQRKAIKAEIVNDGLRQIARRKVTKKCACGEMMVPVHVVLVSAFRWYWRCPAK